ncbi:MAG: DUF421 domain-containing protein, partial [Cryomorphaceae bacterium]
TICAYTGLIFLLRISGKRTLSKMNAFDFVITLALGSITAATIMSKDVALLDGILALALLIFLQFLVSRLCVRVPAVKNLITSKPSLLVYKGEVLDAVLKKERIKIEEIYLVARSSGISDIKDIDAAVLETTGSITVIPKMYGIDDSAFEDVTKKGI